MNFRLFSLPLKNNHLFSKRCFKINPRQLKNTQEFRQPGDKSSKDGPIKYSTSDAGKWKAVYSSYGEEYFKAPRIQPAAIMLSVTAFMVYFCILREENDLDDWLRDVESDIPIQVQELQLRFEIDHGKRRGIDVRYQELKLEELRNLRLNKKKNE